jgi:hypothetical protein
LEKVEYPAGLFTVSEMYSYTASGLVSKKRLHVSKAGKDGFMDVDYSRPATLDAPGNAAVSYV